MDKEPGVRRGRRVEWLIGALPVPWGAEMYFVFYVELLDNAREIVL